MSLMLNVCGTFPVLSSSAFSLWSVWFILPKYALHISLLLSCSVDTAYSLVLLCVRAAVRFYAGCSKSGQTRRNYYASPLSSRFVCPVPRLCVELCIRVSDLLSPLWAKLEGSFFVIPSPWSRNQGACLQGVGGRLHAQVWPLGAARSHENGSDVIVR